MAIVIYGFLTRYIKWQLGSISTAKLQKMSNVAVIEHKPLCIITAIIKENIILWCSFVETSFPEVGKMNSILEIVWF